VRPGVPPGSGGQAPFTHPLAAPGHVPGQPLNLTAPGRGATQADEAFKVTEKAPEKGEAAAPGMSGMPNGYEKIYFFNFYLFLFYF